MTETEKNDLIKAAVEIAGSAYAPYSRFRVGAALLCSDGTIITGVNVENRSYGLTICAERSAIVTAVTRGYRKFRGLCVCCLDAQYPVPPCGACRQVITEFAEKEMPILFVAGKENDEGIREVKETTAEGILPFDSLHELK